MRLEIETRRFYIGKDYGEAVAAFGASPVHLSLIPDREYIASVVAGVDGILLPGSDSDVDPALYGHEPHLKLGQVIPEKDQTDRLVIEEAEKLGLPILAICYGMQALNVYRGGTLVQDIESEIDGCLKHEQGLPRDRGSHGLKLAENGILAKSVADIDLSGDIRVNSHHHQAIGEVGHTLEATAWATDGVIECIEDIDEDKFILGVQWHPELSWSSDRLSARIFEAFVDRCRLRTQ